MSTNRTRLVSTLARHQLACPGSLLGRRDRLVNVAVDPSVGRTSPSQVTIASPTIAPRDGDPAIGRALEAGRVNAWRER